MGRLFVAIDFPAYIQQAIEGLYGEHRGISWVPLAKLHLTLKFIGETGGDIEEALVERLSTLEVQPFLLPVEGVGYFPGKGPPRTLWVGVGRGHPHLFQLQYRVEHAFSGLPVALATRRWSPHITIARCQPSAAEFVRQFCKKNSDFQAPPCQVDRFSLLRSEPGQTGRLYQPIADFVLGGSSASVYKG